MLVALLLLACKPEPADPGQATPPADTDDQVLAECASSADCDDGDGCTVDACDDSECASSPLVCDTPPDPSCADDVTQQTYEDVGTCADDVCSYVATETECAGGCLDGACLPVVVDQLLWVETILGDSVAGAGAAAATDGDVVVTAGVRDVADVGGTLLAGGFRSVVTRLSEDGVVLWAHPLHAPDPANVYDEVLTPAVAADGSLYVGGTVYGTIRLAPDTADELVVPGAAPDQPHGVVAQLDVAGVPTWAVELGGPTEVVVTSLAALDDGTVVVAGEHEGPLTLGRNEPAEVTLPGVAGTSELFAAHYDVDGTLLWAWDGPPGMFAQVGVGPDAVFVTGVFAAAATLDNGDLLTPRGAMDVVVAALDPASGAAVWSDVLASTYLVPMAVAGTPDGGVVLGAVFGNSGDTVLVSPDTAEEATHTAGGLFDSLVAMWDDTGVLSWTRAVSSGSSFLPSAWIGGVAVSDDGQVEVVGWGESPLRLQDGTGGQTSLQGPGPLHDAWAARYASDGLLLSATAAGGPGLDYGYAVAWGGLGPVIVGTFEAQATFGPGEAAETTISFGDSGVGMYGLSL